MGSRIQVVVALLLIACCVPVFSATEVPRVSAVQIENTGSGFLDESFVRAFVRTEVGAPLDRRIVARDLRELLDSGRFSDVSVSVSPDGEDAIVIYQVRRKLVLGSPVQIKGASYFSDGRLRQVYDLAPGDPVDEHIASLRAVDVLKRYHESYFSQARVTATVTEDTKSPGTAGVLLEIEEGLRARIRKVDFVGSRDLLSDELWKAVEPRGWWNPVRWFDRWRYDPERLEMARLSVLSLYRSRGYLDARVEPAEVRVVEDGLGITFRVTEGRAYRIGTVALKGITQFPEELLRSTMEVSSGETANDLVVRGASRALSDYYGSRGYIDVRVRTVLDPRPDEGILNITYDLTEGRIAHIRNVKIQGNSRTRDKVIRRELLVYPGEVFDRVRVRRSERRLSNLGYFENVRSRIVDTPVEEEKDLIMEVEEKRTGQFMIGAGFSSVDNVMGFVELSQGNFDLRGWPYFTGGGQKLKLRAQLGDSRKLYDLSFVEPWFLDRRLALGLDLYLLDRSYSDYDIERTGGAISLTKPLPGPNRIKFRYELETSKITDVSDTNDYFYADSPERSYSFVKEEDRLKSTIGVDIRHDTRNNAFVPTRGNRAVLFGSVSGGYLGGDTDIYGAGFRTSHYLPLWKRHVISLKTRYETVDTYGSDDEIPIDDRLFLGGGQTLRGFDYRDVGPKVRPAGADEADTRYRPVGGRSLAMATVEYTIPLVSGMRLAAFYDIGNVWMEEFTFDAADLASSAGVGLRLDVPGFPVRIDRAWVIDADDDLTDDDPWVIWIGYDY